MPLSGQRAQSGGEADEPSSSRGRHRGGQRPASGGRGQLRGEGSQSADQRDRVRIENLLNDTPSRGRTPRPSGSERLNIFDIECDVAGCDRKFASTAAVAAHKRRVHQEPTTYACHECGSTFSTAPNLNKHIRSVHQKVKPFKCDFCQSSFGFRDGLERHVRMVHDQARPFACSHCSLRFKTKAHLMKHSLSLHPEAHRPNLPSDPGSSSSHQQQ